MDWFHGEGEGRKGERAKGRKGAGENVPPATHFTRHFLLVTLFAPWRCFSFVGQPSSVSRRRSVGQRHRGFKPAAGKQNPAEAGYGYGTRRPVGGALLELKNDHVPRPAECMPWLVHQVPSTAPLEARACSNRLQPGFVYQRRVSTRRVREHVNLQQPPRAIFLSAVNDRRSSRQVFL